MCTVTWIHDEDGYQLLCNRDERLTRKRAIPPELRTRGGVRYLAPVDPDFGGSWIATNEFGLTLCLLNGANLTGTGTARPGCVSRGLLVLDLIGSRSAAAVFEKAGEMTLASFAPFTLAVLEPGAKAAVMEWNGSATHVLPESADILPLTSSSFDALSVREKRRAAFARLVGKGKPEPHWLAAFHESHGGKPDAYSPCMHRADAETVSFSWIQVRPGETSFFYTPGPPCQAMPGETRKLALRP